MNLRKIIIIAIACGLFSGCANHRYIVSKSEKPRGSESVHIRVFSVVGLVPIYRDLDRQTVCAAGKIRVINLHDSALNGLICGATLLLFCPHTVGIECEENEK